MATLLTPTDDKPKVSITLDWLAFTFKESTHEAAKWLRVYASNNAGMAIAPTNGYRDAYRTQNGIVVQWNIDREEMGYHVIIAGSAIRHVLIDNELDQATLIQTVRDAGASITRLDLAKDLQGVNVSLDKIYTALEQKQSIGTARSFSQIHSIGGGNTVYVGSRQSEKFIRIYDKAAQMGLHGVFWYRYELETKGMVARALAALLCESANWASAFDTISRHMVDVPKCDDYQQFFLPGVVEIGIPKLEKKSDREAWIEKQVIPAVLKHVIEFPSSEAVNRLVALIELVKRQGNTPES